MRYIWLMAAFVALSTLPGSVNGQGLSITNYRLISQQQVSARQWSVTYCADVVNAAGALGAITATAETGSASGIFVVAGQDTLTFASVPANGEAASSNTFTLLVDNATPPDLTNLQWVFQGPAAHAGMNQTAKVGNLVLLDGSRSTSIAGTGTLAYSWEFSSRPEGSAALLMNATSAMPSFVVDMPGNYLIALTVSDGVTTSTSRITVSTLNTPPSANAGPDQVVSKGSTVFLNGSGSSDVDGDALNYQWTLIVRPEESGATLI